LEQNGKTKHTVEKLEEKKNARFRGEKTVFFVRVRPISILAKIHFFLFIG